MIVLSTAGTFTGQRVSIMLEETGLAYSAYQVDLAQGEQRQPSTQILLAGYNNLNKDPQFNAACQYLNRG